MITLPLVALVLLSDPLTTAGGNGVPSGYLIPVIDDASPNSSFRYKYAEGAVLLGDFDGIRGDVSWPVQGPWVALGRLDYLTEDEGSTDVDVVLLSGGVGYVHPIPDTENKLDFIGSAEIEFAEAEIDGPGGSADDDDIGLRFRAGARFQANEKIELAGGVSLSTIFDEDVGLDVQGLYSFNENLAGFVGIDIRDDSVAVIGVRFYF